MFPTSYAINSLEFNSYCWSRIIA